LGFYVGQLLRVADVVEAGDAGVLDTDRHDAVDLAVQAYDECRAAVGHGGVNGERAFGLSEAGEEVADHLLGADDRPQLSLPDSAAVAYQDNLRGKHVKQALQVPRFNRALERLQSRPDLARGDHLARAAGIDVLAGTVGDLADGRGALVDGSRDLVVAEIERLAQHEDGAPRRGQRLSNEDWSPRHTLRALGPPRPPPRAAQRPPAA